MCDTDLFGEDFSEDFEQLLDDGLGHLYLLLAEFKYGADVLDLEGGVAAAVELVVDLEDPGVDVEVVRDEARETGLELVAIINVVGGDGRGDVGLLKNALGSGLSLINVDLFWLPRQNGDL